MSAASATTLSDAPPEARRPPAPPAVQPLDLRGASLLSVRQLRKLRMHEEQFLEAAGARVALFLRAEFALKLESIQIVSYQKLTDAWTAPAHLVLFKTEPLRGVSILDIESSLALSMADRLMGGRGKVDDSERVLSEIERALLDQIVQIFLEEWCDNWAAIRPVKPTILGCETDGRFLQTAPAQASMLTLVIEARLEQCAGRIQLAFPYLSLEALLRQLCPENEPAAEPRTAATEAAPQWNRGLDEVALDVTAEWQGVELSAREMLHLQVGDVLQIGSHLSRQICLRLGEQTKFNGRLGTMGGSWAVEITQAVKP
ncbi:MAG: flagellar motor switch protein FliM [Limisphaerales bacterium]